MIEPGGFDNQLLQVLQQPLPICERPFAEIAFKLDTTETHVLETIHKLKAAGVIRRFRPQLNYRALGRVASLVCAHVPHEKFDAVADAVSGLANVSHNYCRDHYYNLWFTLQGTSLIAAGVELAGLQEDFEIEFHSLPATRLFKLDVRFDPAGPALPGEIVPTQAVQEFLIPDIPSLVTLSETQKQLLNVIQGELAITETPFDGLIEGDAVGVLQSLVQAGVIRRVAAVLNYRVLGYSANTMFCAEVPAENIASVGGALAASAMVSHCYERATFDGWPFNLYGMCHAASGEDIEEMTESFCAEHAISNSQLLPTLTELKKEPVKIVF